MISQARILVVDPSTENRDVLCTLLKRLGAETIEAPRMRHVGGLTETARPDVIVFDAEADSPPSPEEINDLGRTVHRSSTPIVVLGTPKRSLTPLTTGHFVAKPYQYAALIRRIDEVLGNRV